jgi:hypothetical protein
MADEPETESPEGAAASKLLLEAMAHEAAKRAGFDSAEGLQKAALAGDLTPPTPRLSSPPLQVDQPNESEPS